MKKSSDFMRSNYHRIVLFIFFVILIVLHQFVLISGDDYYHSTAVSGTLKDFWDFHVHHYLRGNGRALVHFVLTLFFIGKGTLVWRFLNPLVIVSVIVLCSKVFTDNKKDFQVSTVVMSVMFLCLGGQYTSNSIYTLTPVFNYLYPFLLMIPVVYMVKQSYTNDKKYYVLPVVGFFAGATMEQTGIMTIGYIVLIAIKEYLENRKLPKKIVIAALITTLIGYLTVMLAPGNFVRMENSTRPFAENFVAAFTMLINTKSFAVFNILYITALVYRMLSIKSSKKIINIFNILLSAALAAGCAVNLFILFNNKGIDFENVMILSFAWKLFDLAYIFAMVYVPVYTAIVVKKYNMLIHTIIALGSIIILFFASVSEWRPLTPALIIFFVIIAQIYNEMLRFSPKIKFFIAVPAVVLGIAMLTVSMNGYYKNYKTDIKNNELIKEYLAENDFSKPLYILEVPDEETASYAINKHGTHIVGNEGEYSYTTGYKRSHKLPVDTEIVVCSENELQER